MCWLGFLVGLEQVTSSSNGVLIQRVLNLMRACQGSNRLPTEVIKVYNKSLSLEVVKVNDKAMLQHKSGRVAPSKFRKPTSIIPIIISSLNAKNSLKDLSLHFVEQKGDAVEIEVDIQARVFKK